MRVCSRYVVPDASCSTKQVKRVETVIFVTGYSREAGRGVPRRNEEMNRESVREIGTKRHRERLAHGRWSPAED